MRVLRGIGALLILVGLVVGVPVALVILGGSPLPDGFSRRALGDALFRPDDGTVLIGLITIVGWIAWAVLAVSVLAELIVAVSGHRVQVSLPGLVGPRRMIAVLMITVVAMLAVPTAPAQAERAPTDALPRDETAPVSRPRPASAPTQRTQDSETSAESDPGNVRHTVQRGDELWGLAEEYYGHGREWRKIAAANPDVLTGGPDRLQPGWVLVIPGAATPAETDGRTVTVRAGETLSSIAAEHLGDALLWPAIFRANRATLSTPDAVDEGSRLIIPGGSAQRESKQQGSTQKDSIQKDSPQQGSTQEDSTQEDSTQTSGSAQERDRSKDGRDTSEESAAEKEPRAEEPSPAGPGPGESTTGPSSRDGAVEEGPSGEPVEASARAQPPTHDGPARPRDPVEAASVAGLVGIGGLMAAGLVAGLAARRRLQLLTRPVGRRILQPSAAAQLVETQLARRARPLSLRTLDLAIRAISAHCRSNQTPLPTLRMARVADDTIELTMAERDLAAPVGFVVTGDRWLLGNGDADYLKSVHGLSEAARPYPALVTLGRDNRGALVLVDLETVGILPVRAGDAERASGMLRAMALELSGTPWAQELTLSLTGRSWSLPQALGVHHVAQVDDVDDMLDNLEVRVTDQRDHLANGLRIADNRTDPDLADPWAPEIILVDGPLTAAQLTRLQSLVMDEPRPPVATVINTSMINTGMNSAAEHEGDWHLELSDHDGEARATLSPYGIELEPQVVDRAIDDQIVELLSATGSEETTAAPWWAPEPAGQSDGNVTFIAHQENGWAREESAIVTEQIMLDPSAAPRHPLLRLLGPVDLLGTTGERPSRAGRQCLEYCAWLLEHPGTTAQQMAAALAVAEGTRRSNMSRLRGWLGSQDDGEAYLPDAYTGSIRLNPCVSSDWDRLKLLTTRGVNRVSIDSLTAALTLVRGAPLADAAPGQWHWAEEMRTDMASVIRDVGVELTHRALDDHDLDLARWAASRSLVAAPEDELLICARIRTEFEAGNQAAVERLALQLTAHARQVGIDLEEETITLLQRTLEGRPRARLA